MTTSYTPRFRIPVADFNTRPWHQIMASALGRIDNVLWEMFRASDIVVWENDTEFRSGQTVLDELTGLFWTVLVNHTSPATPDTFEDSRTDNPSYWSLATYVPEFKNVWQPDTFYAATNFVLVGSSYYVSRESHTSGAVFNDDLIAGKWAILIDVETILTELNSIADAVAADQDTVAADKVIVAADKATVAADKATVASDRTAVEALFAAASTIMAFKGNWNAGTGAFPSGAASGYAYRVSNSGYVNGIWFAVGDLLMALVINASTSVYSGNWMKLQSELSGPLFHAVDLKASSTQGGTSSAGFNTRVLNTVLTNSISGASLSSNQITLPSGRYRITASAPCYQATGTKLNLYNVTDASVQVVGESMFVGAASTDQVRCIVRGTFTITATKVFQLEHYTAVGVASFGLGGASGSGFDEVYASIEIERLGP